MEEFKPTTVWLTVNRACNFRCKWCYAQNTNYQLDDIMCLDLAKNLAELSFALDIKNLLLIGGEPTLWLYLFEFNNFCLSLGLKTTLITNGFNFGDDRFWQMFLEKPTCQIGLSLKAHNKNKLIETTGINNFKKLEKGIKRILDNYNTVPSITYNIFYVNDLVEMVKFLSDCGAKKVKIDFCSVIFENKIAKNKYMVDPFDIVKNILSDYQKMEDILKEGVVFEMMLPFCLWPLDFIKQLKQRGKILSVCHVIKRK